jgi:hypothetical protein
MTKLQEQAYLQFAETLDKQEAFFSLLSSFETNHGFLPVRYATDARLMNSYEAYKKFGSWREQPLIKLLLKRAAKKAA